MQKDLLLELLREIKLFDSDLRDFVFLELSNLDKVLSLSNDDVEMIIKDNDPKTRAMNLFLCLHKNYLLASDYDFFSCHNCKAISPKYLTLIYKVVRFHKNKEEFYSLVKNIDYECANYVASIITDVNFLNYPNPHELLKLIIADFSMSVFKYFFESKYACKSDVINFLATSKYRNILVQRVISNSFNHKDNVLVLINILKTIKFSDQAKAVNVVLDEYLDDMHLLDYLNFIIKITVPDFVNKLEDLFSNYDINIIKDFSFKLAYLENNFNIVVNNKHNIYEQKLNLAFSLLVNNPNLSLQEFEKKINMFDQATLVDIKNYTDFAMLDNLINLVKNIEALDINLETKGLKLDKLKKEK